VRQPKNTKIRKAAAAKSEAGKSLKRRRRSNALENALERRSSSAHSAQSYIAFNNAPLLEDRSTDVLTGNPFAPPPKAKKPSNRKAKSTGKTKRKIARAEPKPAKDRDLPTKKKGILGITELLPHQKKTILGRPYVEPLIVAPAKRLSKPKRGPSSASSGGTSKSNLRSPASSVGKSSPKSPSASSLLSTSDQNHRGRRSSAPTPSPSLASSSISVTKISKRTKGDSKPPSPISTTITYKKRASYDVPFSDARAIVPPNTPAFGLLNKTSMSSEGGGSAETTLDIGQLNDKIGKVKTTRGGLVRELPITVSTSVISKGKARGRSVSMKVVEEKKKVKGVSGKVQKRKKEKPASMEEVPPAQSVRKRKSEVDAVFVGQTETPKETKRARKSVAVDVLPEPQGESGAVAKLRRGVKVTTGVTKGKRAAPRARKSTKKK
jgi:hypothetical protein